MALSAILAAQNGPRRNDRAMSDDIQADFPGLSFDRPSEGILTITLDAPGLNSVDRAVHRQLADVWLAVDRDPATRWRCSGVRERDSPPGGASNSSRT